MMRTLRCVFLFIALPLGFVTLALVASVPSYAAIEPSVKSVTAASVTLAWTAPGDDGNVGRASQYDVRFSSNQIQRSDTLSWWTSPSTTVCAGLPRPSAAGSTDSFVVTGLAASSTYYFVIRTADEIPNWSFFSNIAVVTTAALPDTNKHEDETPPPPVAGLTATPTGGGISLAWSPSSAPDVAGYLVYRSYSQHEYEVLTQQLVYETTYLDGDVLPGVSYSYSVTAVDESGNESPLAQAVSATAPSVPPVATRLLAPFPDPCLSDVVLRYEIAEDGMWGILKVFDISGRLVRDLTEGRMDSGQYAVVWDLKANNGERVAPGIYLCVLISKDLNSSKKFAVLK
jgi:hypothetical protein